MTWPGAICDLSLQPGGPSLQAAADPMGVVTFQARPAAPTDAHTAVYLDCQDASGRTGSFTVDLTAASSFQPLNVAVPAALIRPALTGDLTQYSPAYLWANGYGMRPDPTMEPNVYAVWSSSVTSPARSGGSQTHPMRGSLTVFDFTATAWSGGALIDSNAFFPSSTFGSYLTTFYIFNAPSFNLSSQPASCTAAGIWGGLGGIGGSLIQTGLVAASLDDFFGILEPVYQFPNFNNSNTNTCYGSVCSFSFGGVEQDDLMLGQSWSCDSDGATDMNGDYGCFYLADVTQSMYGSEILEKEDTFLGESAEVVIENVSKQADFCGSSGQFYEFGSSTMDLAAQRTDTGSLAHQFSTDDALQFNIDGGLDEVSIDTSSYDTTITCGCSGNLMSAAGTVNDDTADYYFYSAGTEQVILE